MLLPLSGDRGVGSYLSKYIEKDFYRHIKISKGPDDVEITDPEDFEVDPTGQGNHITSSDLFYNQISTAVAVSTLYQALLWSNPSVLLFIKQMIKDLDLSQKYQMTDEFLREVLIQICQPRKKKFQQFLDVFVQRYKNDGNYSSIYNAVMRSQLNLAIQEILQKSKHVNSFHDTEFVSVFSEIFCQDIILLDDYEPVKRQYKQSQIFIYHNEFPESPYFVLSKFKDDDQLQGIFDVQKKLFLKNVQIFIINMDTLQKSGKEHILTYVKEAIQNGTYETFLAVLFMYDDKLTIFQIRELIEAKTAIKDIFSQRQGQQYDDNMTSTMVFENNTDALGHQDPDDEEYNPHDYNPQGISRIHQQQDQLYQTPTQLQTDPQKMDDEDEEYDPTQQ